MIVLLKEYSTPPPPPLKLDLEMAVLPQNLLSLIYYDNAP